ncbi:hypothetical protein DYB30_002909 [Aphanomyces astaci]|uniref:EGF-like domain-containing protein n=1 Tax=Aphanomyces astaci TaxID=112090 RepID=A0A397EYF5_APHAT|nr:hypothetical protein DYB30_002909 [Aphanomyces astaci]RHZ02585.1 hypothetical protein DYB31_005837 [Aphanomyces astaci]
MKGFLAMYVVAATVLMASAATPKTTAPAREKDAGKCETDEDCTTYPGTVCVQFSSGDYVAGKCTPNYGQKPVCRGGQSGLCPQYQDPTQGYLNTQCVLVDRSQQPATGDALVPVDVKTPAPTEIGGDDTVPAVPGSVKPATTGGAADLVTPTTTKKSAPTTTAAAPQPPKVPGSRRLQVATPTTTGKTTAAGAASTPAPTTAKVPAATAEPTAAPVDPVPVTDADATAGPTTADDITPIKPQACPSNSALSLDNPDCWFNTVYKNRTIQAQYRCVDYSMCYEQSAASQEPQKDKEEYCRPKGCVSGDRQMCNNRGTCQSNDRVQPMMSQGYSCRCYAGFTGRQCEKTTGNTCDVDCGVGGACIDRKCSCYDAYQGKDARCAKCTKDAACENGNKCNVETGKCDCLEGFIGLTCGGKLNNCAGVTCNNGGQPFDGGKTCTCKCAKCVGNVCPPCGGENGRDCTVETGGCPAVLKADDVASAAGYVDVSAVLVVFVAVAAMVV